jgi:ABC-type uncharacterized transport system substrate-binding protein
MHTKRLLMILMTMVLALSISGAGFAQNFPVTPKHKADGSKFRVAYLQGGPYFEYDQVFLAVILQLRKLGWLENVKIPSRFTKDAAGMYEFLSTNSKVSNYLEFSPDAFYDSNWQDDLRLANKRKLVERLKKKDIDIIFALGTWAGQDMKNMPPEFTIPAVVMDVSDALKSEIVDSNEDTGRDNLTARVDPLRYQRQIAMFHDIIGFTKLGMAYEDTVEGRSYAAITDVEAMAAERGFEIVKELHPGYVKSKEKAEEWLLRAIKRLAPKIDAFYFTQQLAIDQNSLPKYLEVLNKRGIPTFSQTGSVEVRNGVLLSIATSGFKYVAEYHAKKIARILNGAKPRSLPILFEDPAKIAINLKTCQEIGFDPPVDILGAADEIFTE